MEAILTDQGFGADAIREQAAKVEVEASPHKKGKRRDPGPVSAENINGTSFLFERLFQNAAIATSCHRVPTRADQPSCDGLDWIPQNEPMPPGDACVQQCNKAA